MWNPSKFGTAVARALAARSSTDIVGIVALSTTTAVVVCLNEDGEILNNSIAVKKNSSNNNNNHDIGRASYNSGNASAPLSVGSSCTIPSLSSTAAGMLLTGSTKTSCAAAASSPPGGSSNDALRVGAPPSSHRITRLARRRTLKRMEETSEKVTLKSKYDVEEVPIGEGAYGAVYIGRNKATGEKVAIKKIEKEFTDNAMFQREMDAFMHIRSKGGHPNICGLQENFDEGDYYFLVLDLVSGGEMFDHLCAQGPYSEADAARLIREAGSALAFMHGIGVVHGDMKPENLMLSSKNPLHAVVKIVDFGCGQVISEDNDIPPNRVGVATTVAYCPPEVIVAPVHKPVDASFDMWALGIILYVMLTGIHPFDIDCDADDEQVQDRILSRQEPPLRNSPITAHLSESAIDLIEKLIKWDPKERMTAHEMLNHPWVRGETAKKDKIAGSDKKLSNFHAFMPSIEAKVFTDMIKWSEDYSDNVEKERQTSLIERSFHNLDSTKRGYVTTDDLRKISKQKKGFFEKEDKEQLSLSGFHDLLSATMKNQYFPKGHIVYNEGDIGEHMYFINSGTIEVITKDGHSHFRTHGDSFGSGALLNKKKLRGAKVRCVTPVHVIEISRDFFDKQTKTDGSIVPSLLMKDKSMKQQSAKRLLKSKTNECTKHTVRKNEYVFEEGEIKATDAVYILEDGEIDVSVKGNVVFSINEPGDFCGEHSVLFHKPRNTTAKCISDYCTIYTMKGSNFRDLLKTGPDWFQRSIHDVSCAREFQKALVIKSNKSLFRAVSGANDEKSLREAFDSADINHSGSLDIGNIRHLLKSFDADISEDDIKMVVDALDLDHDGEISWEEFKRLFNVDYSHRVRKLRTHHTVRRPKK